MSESHGEEVVQEAYPFPKAVIAGFDDEEAYNEWLAETLERFGWDTRLEVSSDCGTARCDLIVEHDKWGIVGIESKYKEKIRPRNWAKALKQIQRYEQCDFGTKINQWAISADQSLIPEGDPFELRGKQTDYREFINTMGYGVLNTDTRMELVFNNSNPMVKIPIAQIEYPTGRLAAPDVSRLADCDTEEARQYIE